MKLLDKILSWLKKEEPQPQPTDIFTYFTNEEWEKIKNNPVFFAERVLGMKLYDYQKEFLRNRTMKTRVEVRPPPRGNNSIVLNKSFFEIHRGERGTKPTLLIMDDIEQSERETRINDASVKLLPKLMFQSQVSSRVKDVMSVCFGRSDFGVYIDDYSESVIKDITIPDSVRNRIRGASFNSEGRVKVKETYLITVQVECPDDDCQNRLYHRKHTIVPQDLYDYIYYQLNTLKKPVGEALSMLEAMFISMAYDMVEKALRKKDTHICVYEETEYIETAEE